MTVARVRETGRGYYQGRLAIDGLPYEAVTGRSMERTAADGRIRKMGLDLSTVTLQARADLARASIDSQGFRGTMRDIRRIWTQALRRPSLETALVADLAIGATSATVADTAQFPATGVFHIGTEAISYTGKAVGPTRFTGLTRGIWGTVEQAHYIPDGERLQYPRVTDRPLSLEGRRARLSLYGPGDDPQGDGTPRWLGICATDAAYDGEGTWSVSIDPITRILAQQVGGDLSESVPIRGIHYPANRAFAMLLVCVNPATGAVVAQVVVRLAGFFETQADFCAALTVAIAARIAATGAWVWAVGSSITAQAVNTHEWRLIYTPGTGGGTVAQIAVRTETGIPAGTGPESPFTFGSTGTSWLDYDGSPTAVMVAGGYYWLRAAAEVPRGVVGLGDFVPSFGGGVVTGPTDTAYRIYLGGLVVPTSTMAGFLEDGDGDPMVLDIVGANTAGRYIVANNVHRYVGPETRFRIGRRLASGTLETLRSRLQIDSPVLCNAGAMPLITINDILPASDVTEAAAGNRLATDRVFDAFEAVTLSEIVEPELRALGCYQRISSLGSIEWAKLRVGLETDDADAVSITDRDIKGPVRLERSQYGTISSVVYRTGYNALKGEWKGSVTARDAQASAPNKAAQPIEIAQRSYPLSRAIGAIVAAEEAAPEDVVRVAMPLFGLFGAAYDTWTIPLGPSFGGLLIGQFVSVTSTRIPNAVTGLLGVVNQIGVVTGTSEDAGTGAVTLEVLVHGQQFAGYAPGVELSGQTLVAGNTWDVDCTAVSDYIDSGNLRDHFRVGDLVRVTQFDSAAPTEVLGTVTAETSNTRVRVAFASAWVPGVSTWMLRARTSTSYAATERVAKYAFQADVVTRKIDFSGADATARVLAP